MTIRGNIWASNRPIKNSLPGLFEQYSENEVVDVLTKYWDEVLISSKGTIDGLKEQMNPITCDEKFLPLLAFLSGFTNSYDITNYPISAQRNLIDQSYQFIWRYKGSENVLSFILNELGYNSFVWVGSRLIAGETSIPHIIGEIPFTSFILLPINYNRYSQEWRLAEDVIDLYSPAYSDDKLCYDAFFAGYSVADDPTFDWASISVEEAVYAPEMLLEKIYGVILRGAWGYQQLDNYYSGFADLIRRDDNVRVRVEIDTECYRVTLNSRISVVTGSTTATNLEEFLTGHIAYLERRYDRSDKGNDWVQTDPYKQPIYGENGDLIKDSAGKPALKFDGIDDFLEGSELVSTPIGTIVSTYQLPGEDRVVGSVIWDKSSVTIRENGQVVSTTNPTFEAESGQTLKVGKNEFDDRCFEGLIGSIIWIENDDNERLQTLEQYLLDGSN